MNRQEHISRIFEKNGSEIDDEDMTVLERYISDLEIYQPARPARIDSILETDTSPYSTDTMGILDAYIADLESKQVIVLPEDSQIPETNSKRSPIWALRRRIQLERRRRIQLDKKRHTNHSDD